MQRYDWPGESADSDGKQSSFSTERKRGGGEKDFTMLHHYQASQLVSYKMKIFIFLVVCFPLFLIL